MDYENPRTRDLLGISLWEGNSLLYSSNWTGLETAEQTLDGGQLLIHSGFSLEGSGGKAGSIIPEILLLNENSDLKVYPNPFTEKLFFDFVSPNDGKAKIEIYDITGRKLETVFDKTVDSKQHYRIEYLPKRNTSNAMFYRVIIDEEVFTGKVIYQIIFK